MFPVKLVALTVIILQTNWSITLKWTTFSLSMESIFAISLTFKFSFRLYFLVGCQHAWRGWWHDMHCALFSIRSTPGNLLIYLDLLVHWLCRVVCLFFFFFVFVWVYGGVEEWHHKLVTSTSQTMFTHSPWALVCWYNLFCFWML